MSIARKGTDGTDMVLCSPATFTSHKPKFQAKIKAAQRLSLQIVLRPRQLLPPNLRRQTARQVLAQLLNLLQTLPIPQKPKITKT